MQVIKIYKTLFDKTKKQYCYLKNDRIEYCEVPVLIPLTKKMHFKFLPLDVRQYAVENCYIKHMELKVKSYGNLNNFIPLALLPFVSSKMKRS